MRNKRVITALLLALTLPAWASEITGNASKSGNTGSAGIVRVGGVGSLTPLIEKLAADFRKQNPQVDVQVAPVPLGSAGSLRALAAGQLDIALTGRLPNSNEAAGKTQAWVRTPLVFASNGGLRAKGFSRQDIADVYAGRLTSWDDKRPMTLVMRAVKESETMSLKAMSPAISAAVDEGLKRPGMALAENDLDALTLLTRSPGTFGTVALGLVRSSNAALKIFPIDGVAPSAKALAAQRYPWFRSYWLVRGTAPAPATESFVAYLQSPRAIKIMSHLEFLPEH